MKNYLGLMTLTLITAILFERGVRNISEEYIKLESFKKEVAEQMESALLRKQKLERQIMSQSDPSWITLTLIRVLGVVPEGQTKVYFKTTP